MLVPAAMNGNESGSSASAQLAASWSAVGEALAAAEAFCADALLDPDARARLLIVVEELVANIVEHGHPPEGGTIEMSLSPHPDGTALTLVDGGMVFDPRSAPPRDRAPQRGGGAGLALVRAWSRIESYARDGGRNRLDLVVLAPR